MKHLPWIWTVFILLSGTGTCRGGWVISETNRDNYGNKSSQSTFIQQNQIRFENASTITIFNLNDSTLTIVFPTLRAYWHGVPSELITGMFDAFEVQLQTLIVELPYDQQPVYQQMYDSLKVRMRHQDTSKITNRMTLERIDSVMKINQFKVDGYRIVMDSVTKEEFWMTRDVNPYTEVDIHLFIEMNNRINPYSRKGTTLNSLEYINLLSNGLIVKSKKFGQNGHFIETEVENLKQIPIPIDFFYPPVNYRKVSLVDVFNLPTIEADDFPEK